MKPLSVSRALKVITLSIFSFAAVASSHAQDIQGGATRKDLTVSGAASSSVSGGGGGGGGGGSSYTRRPTVRTRTVTETKVIVKTPTTGAISVSGLEPKASVFIEPINIRGQEGLDATVPADKRGFSFSNLKPGTYRVAAELEGYESDEKTITVAANRVADVTLNIRPIQYTVTIKTTNVPSGEVRYAPVVAIGNDPVTNEPKYNPAGKTSIAKIQNGMAKITELAPGTYGIDIRPDDKGYETKLATFKVPGPDTYTLEMKKERSEETFMANWSNLSELEAPQGWSVSARKLNISGPGVAFPRDDKVRHYMNFRLTADVNMINGVAASFAVRAMDNRNYYLVQLTGPRSDEPYVLRGFIVKNGVAQQRFGSSIPLDAFQSALQPGKFFELRMVMTGNAINVSITNSQTGESLPVGTLVDQYATYEIGAVGLAARDNEQNEIGRFIVCSDKCPRE